MITAKEARENAKRITTDAHEKQLTDVELKIQAAIEKGEMRAFFYDSLSRPVMEHLKERGYNVSSSFHRNEMLVTISWDEDIKGEDKQSV